MFHVLLACKEQKYATIDIQKERKKSLYIFGVCNVLQRAFF